ncbi:MAG: SCO family protein [Comamonadaceae bacterium]|nr:SCO family protein [Comamonadaceae bacterium]
MLMVFVALIAGALAWAVFFWQPGQQSTPPAHEPLPLAKPPTGGDFNLEGPEGPVALKDYRGKVVLLFFGYTHCPDICPTSLSVTAQALTALDESEHEAGAGAVRVRRPGARHHGQAQGLCRLLSSEDPRHHRQGGGSRRRPPRSTAPAMPSRNRTTRALMRWRTPRTPISSTATAGWSPASTTARRRRRYWPKSARCCCKTCRPRPVRRRLQRKTEGARQAQPHVAAPGSSQ